MYIYAVQRIGYYIALPFIYLISLCPFWLLFGVSDFLFVILFYLVGYRKKVVYENLKNAFPEKSDKELKRIRRAFYSYFCDLTLESFKTLTMSRETALKHCYIEQKTVDLFNSYYEQNKSIIIVLGHFGNWEWSGNAFSLQGKHQLYVIYHPLTNPYFNGLMTRMRTRFGTRIIPMKDTFRQMTKNKNERSATGFIADQTPAPESAYWTKFMNQDTPIFRGTELMACRFNYPVIYVNVMRIKRGYYKIYAASPIEEPGKTAEGFISEWHTRELEKAIYLQPETWLWSHRRWKHKTATSQ